MEALGVEMALDVGHAHTLSGTAVKECIQRVGHSIRVMTPRAAITSKNLFSRILSSLK